MANDSQLKTHFRWFLSLLLACGLAAAPERLHAQDAAFESARNSITAGEAGEIIDFLASDALEGRAIGTRGGHAASKYLVEQLTKLKLTPGGTDRSWYQPFSGNARNVIGVVRGSDPVLSKEYIVVGAHYDHVGYGTERNSYGPTGKIHNGADDNASGVAAQLEVIEAIQSLPTPPKRSIIFAFWDGEEDGLLGSIHWCNHPTVPLSSVKLAFNMDMVGRLRNKTVEIYGSRTAPGLRQLVSRWNRDELKLEFTWEMKADSDHHSFFEKRVPVLMFHTGLHDEYHRPSDDAHLINLPGVEQCAKLLFGVLCDAADRPLLGGFRRASEKETEDARIALVNRAAEAKVPRFGVAWREPDQEPSQTAGRPGVTITRVVPGSPAAAAGLMLGDRLMTFNRMEITSSAQLRRAITMSPAHAVVEVTRSGLEGLQTADVQLRGTPVRVGLTWRDDDAEPGVVVVQHVSPDSPAEAAGMKVGDRVLAVEGRPFKNADDLRDIFSQLAGPVTVDVERVGCHKQTAIEVDSRVAGRAK